MEGLLLPARVVVRTSNIKISRRRLADYVKKLNQKACRTCSTIIFSHSTNQIVDLWRCRRYCRCHFLTSLLSIRVSPPHESSKAVPFKHEALSYLLEGASMTFESASTADDRTTAILEESLSQQRANILQDVGSNLIFRVIVS